MALFPNLKPEYYTDGDKDILQRMEEFYTDSITMNQEYWAEADLDTRFYCGDQTVWNDVYGNVSGLNSRQFNFNRIRRIVEMPCGYQRKNRKSTIVTPVENSDQLTADQFTKILMWINRQEGMNETISEAFTGSVISGMNLMQVWMDYREDPISGNIKISNCSYNSFVIDPYFKKQDLSDCNSIWKRSYVTKQQAYSLLPEREKDIDSLYGLGGKDGKFQYLPENYDYNQKNLLTYDEFYYRDYRKQKMLVDTESGETMEWTGEDKELREYLSMYPTVTSIDQDIPTVKLAIVVQGRVMYDGPNPIGIDQYPFVPVLGYYTPELPYFKYRIQGMVRGLRDAQYLYNRRKVIELDILESQVNSGWVAKENSFVDPKSPYKTGQGQVLWLKEEAQMTDVQQIQASSISPAMFQMSDQMGREIQEISGVNEELLGSASDDKAGILAQLRQGAGLTTLQRLFDQLDNSQKLLGRILIKLIQNNFTPGKIKRIIEEEPSPQFYDKNFGKYDASVEEGFDTATQKQLQFAQMLHLKEVGVPVSSKQLLNAATLQNKNELIEEIQQQEQQEAQQAQAQAQMALKEQSATLDLAKARSVADIAMAQERMSRIEENKSLAIERETQSIENLAEANSKKQDALLSKAKALKELQQLDMQQLRELIALYNVVKQQGDSDKKQQDQQNLSLMSQLSELKGMKNPQQPEQPQQPSQPVDPLSQV